MEDYSNDLPMTSLGRAKIRSTFIFLFALIVTAFVIGFLFDLGPQAPPENILSEVDDFPPEHIWFNNSEPLSIYNQLRRHVVVIYFCRLSTLSEVRYFSRLQGVEDEFHGQPLAVIIALQTEETEFEELAETVADWGITLPVIVDNRGEVSSRFNVSTFPSLLVLDAQSRVSARFYTGWDQADLRGIAHDLLEQERAMVYTSVPVFQQDGGSYLPAPPVTEP